MAAPSPIKEPGYWDRNKALIGYLILVGAVLASLYATKTTRDKQDNAERAARIAQASDLDAINKAQCQSIRNLYQVIRKTLKDADDRLDTIDYYKTHRSEARVQHRQNLVTIEKFRNPPCPPDITVQK